MRKLGYVIAAISAMVIAAPSIASAETVVVKHRDHMHRDMHRDWHHAWNRDRHHDKTVIIKHRRHEG
jgi:Ni/Co efflux regulator RcnB